MLFYNPTLKENASFLESRKSILTTRILEAELEASLNAPTGDMIKKYLKRF